MFTHYFRFSSRAAGHRGRSPLLERLLARADTATAATDWRADAFRVIAASTAVMPGVGPASLYREFGALDAASVYIATPVHYIAEMSNVRLPTDGILVLRQTEADELAADFDRVWNGAGVRLRAGRRSRLFLLADQALQATTHDPDEVLDRHIENNLPAGAASPQLRGLMSEMEMWLFGHAVNRTRSASGEALVNGVWLWGGGPALTSLSEVQGWTAGDDPFFSAFSSASSSAFSVRPDMLRGAASGVVATTAAPGTSEWGVIETWLEESARELGAGRIARLNLSAGARCFSLSARGRWRFWRRPRPWWESFE